MKYSLLFLLFSAFIFAQKKENTTGQLSETEFSNLKEYLKSKNLEIKDTIVIKYDYNKESCWSHLDERDKYDISQVLKGFQENIAEFNKRHKNAIAVNFREPGNKINKLKLWDKTIVIDENLFLKKLIFSEKNRCGNSAVILYDGSYLLMNGDPHFSLLNMIEKLK